MSNQKSYTKRPTVIFEVVLRDIYTSPEQEDLAHEDIFPTEIRECMLYWQDNGAGFTIKRPYLFDNDKHFQHYQFQATRGKVTPPGKFDFAIVDNPDKNASGLKYVLGVYHEYGGLGVVQSFSTFTNAVEWAMERKGFTLPPSVPEIINKSRGANSSQEQKTTMPPEAIDSVDNKVTEVEPEVVLPVAKMGLVENPYRTFYEGQHAHLNFVTRKFKMQYVHIQLDPPDILERYNPDSASQKSAHSEADKPAPYAFIFCLQTLDGRLGFFPRPAPKVLEALQKLRCSGIDYFVHTLPLDMSLKEREMECNEMMEGNVKKCQPELQDWASRAKNKIKKFYTIVDVFEPIEKSREGEQETPFDPKKLEIPVKVMLAYWTRNIRSPRNSRKFLPFDSATEAIEAVMEQQATVPRKPADRPVEKMPILQEFPILQENLQPSREAPRDLPRNSAENRHPRDIPRESPKAWGGIHPSKKIPQDNHQGLEKVRNSREAPRVNLRGSGEIRDPRGSTNSRPISEARMKAQSALQEAELSDGEDKDVLDIIQDYEPTHSPADETSSQREQRYIDEHNQLLENAMRQQWWIEDDRQMLENRQRFLEKTKRSYEHGNNGEKNGSSAEQSKAITDNNTGDEEDRWIANDRQRALESLHGGQSAPESDRSLLYKQLIIVPQPKADPPSPGVLQRFKSLSWNTKKNKKEGT